MVNLRVSFFNGNMTNGKKGFDKEAENDCSSSGVYSDRR